MSVILFYSPFDQRSRDTETLMIAFRRQGHRVISLSQAAGSQIHDHLKKHDIETYTHKLNITPGFFYYLNHVIYFINFCRLKSVDVVYCHLESANIVGALGQYFIKAKVFIVRHHIEEARLQKFDRSLLYRLTYRLAKKVIVVSKRAKDFMISEEKASPDKIIHINLAYDFNLYAKPDPATVERIRDRSYTVTLLTAARLTRFKRTDLSIRLLKKLVDDGVRSRLILLGRGEEEGNLKELVADLGLTDHVQMPGYVSNICDYMAASDFMVHPSILESSCVVAKEAALVHLPVIVCKGIGDFDDYIEHEKNGFLVDKENFVTEAAQVVGKYMNTPLDDLTANLHRKVTEIFGIENIIHKYEPLNN